MSQGKQRKGSCKIPITAPPPAPSESPTVPSSVSSDSTRNLPEKVAIQSAPQPPTQGIALLPHCLPVVQVSTRPDAASSPACNLPSQLPSALSYPPPQGIRDPPSKPRSIHQKPTGNIPAETQTPYNQAHRIVPRVVFPFLYPWPPDNPIQSAPAIQFHTEIQLNPIPTAYPRRCKPRSRSFPL